MMTSLQLKSFLLFSFCMYDMTMSAYNVPQPSCPYGPCEVPQCCENGIAVRVNNVHFAHRCPDRGCFSCLSQQYLLGIHERCSLDQSLMKSLCAPGLSCLIYCSQKVAGIEACWNRYGTCQHDHVPVLANQRFPGNVTVLPGLTMNDAKRAPLCTRERTICNCRSDMCESKRDEKPWCFLANIKNPATPTQNCYRDVRWSATYGSFFSSEGCVRRRAEVRAREEAQINTAKAPAAGYGTMGKRRTGQDEPAQAMANFEKMATTPAQPVSLPQAEIIPTPPQADPSTGSPPTTDDFYWNFDGKSNDAPPGAAAASAHLTEQKVALDALKNQTTAEPVEAVHQHDGPGGGGGGGGGSHIDASQLLNHRR